MLNVDTLRAGFAELEARRAELSSKDWAAGPWSITVADRAWVCGTDGHVFVAVAGEFAPGKFIAAPDSVLKVASSWMQRERVNPRSVSAGDLNRFFEVGKATAPCSACKDKREWECRDCLGGGSQQCECHCGHQHESDCDACDGTGKVKCETCQPVRKDPVRVFDIVLNRWKVSSALEVVTPEPEAVVVISAERDPASKYASERLVMQSADGSWFAMVMGLKDTETAKVFQLPVSCGEAQSVGVTP